MSNATDRPLWHIEVIDDNAGNFARPAYDEYMENIEPLLIEKLTSTYKAGYTINIIALARIRRCIKEGAVIVDNDDINRFYVPDEKDWDKTELAWKNLSQFPTY